ncbi:hypothetical protein Ancab_032179 [Ancistrocladus abbreviatus]
MMAAKSEGKYDDLISRGVDRSSRFIAFNQWFPDSKSILRRCSQRFNLKKEHLDPWSKRRLWSFYRSFHPILHCMFDLQSSSPTCDRLAIVSELSPLDQGRRDPMRFDFLVITMKKRKKGIVATDVQLNILLYQPITRRGGQNSRHMQAMHQGENGEPEVSGSDSSNYRGHFVSTRLVT